MDQVPEAEIEQAETEPSGDHSHDGLVAEDGSLADHLAAVHGLDVPPGMSSGTAEGLHDRLHATSKAADD